MQTLNGDSKLLRIFIGEFDKIGHTPLYEAILLKAKETGMAGGTIMRGILSYGATSILHTAKIIDLSEDLPIIVEVIDHDKKIEEFIKIVGIMLEEAGCGGLITVEAAKVIYYKPKSKKDAI